MENKKEENNSDINENSSNNNNDNSENVSTEEKTLAEYGYLTKINGEIFNPEEVQILIGDPMTREITQIINFLCESYPIEAISYCLQRCYYNTFSKTSLLDKIIKYLLTKYPEGEFIINDLLFAYKDNHLTANITSVNQFNSINNYENRQLTKLVFYDSSKEGVDVKKLNFNEIFIEIDEIYIEDNNINNINDSNNNIISLDENENQASFLCDKHHLFKRFCKRGNNIYVYNFIGFEKVKILKRKKKGKKILEENEIDTDNSVAVFLCEQNGCKSKYRYNFSSNRFTEIIAHDNDHIIHEINDKVPSYYKQNIDLLKEKPHITDIQLIRTGKSVLK